ncbi:magnesium and cobalt transport protein CorA [Microbacterium sp. 4R-513]|uniref:magnesium and cobalt transport protein CorA n=1 Tax=Microbacterium sp. 4R-513 TaxID=2567934 RepID=UPI0013E1880D|nr:magnesium and cobalt transport protein CorA [Microbacterium sp. 4R-513]QIG40522.1 magnesium and cobalt transport protein CorA [Microbacterium sp. 4R-513]
MTLIDDAIYVDGRRVASPASLAGTLHALDLAGGFAWIGLYRPTEEELGTAAAEFGLHELAVEDALTGHQRAKLDRYGETRFVVLRPARYIDADESVEFGEVHVFVGPNFVIAIRHAESPDLAKVRARLESAPDLLQRGPLGVLYAIVDQVVDEYEPVVAGLENDIDEIEFQLFSGDRAVAKRIYGLAGEVMELQRAIRPLVKIITTLREDLESGDADDPHALELRRSFRDVLDHVISITEKADEFRQTLSNALMTHSTLVAQQQNDEMRTLTETSLAQSEQAKKISGWAAIIFAPSLVAAIYGMNFRAMPGTSWGGGFLFALLLMLASAVVLYLVFRARRWL